MQANSAKTAGGASGAARRGAPRGTVAPMGGFLSRLFGRDQPVTAKLSHQQQPAKLPFQQQPADWRQVTENWLHQDWCQCMLHGSSIAGCGEAPPWLKAHTGRDGELFMKLQDFAWGNAMMQLRDSVRLA